MHNGQISGFQAIKRRALASLSDELFLFPQGHTDSEIAFTVFLNHLREPKRAGAFDYRELREAMLATIRSFNAWAREASVEEVSIGHLPSSYPQSNALLLIRRLFSLTISFHSPA